MDKQEKAAAVIELMHSGLSMRQACIQADITQQSFLRRVEADPALAEKYAGAREALIDKLADELLTIADAPVGSTESGSTDSGAVQKQRLQVDTRKWLLSKLAPRKYGEKVTLAGDAENPLAIQKIERVIIEAPKKS